MANSVEHTEVLRCLHQCAESLQVKVVKVVSVVLQTKSYKSNNVDEIKGWFSNLKYWFHGKSELSSLILTNYKYIFVSKLFKVCTSVYKISITKYIHTNERQAVRPFWPRTKAFILRLMCAWGQTLCVKIRIKDNNHYYSGEIVNCHAINSNISFSKKRWFGHIKENNYFLLLFWMFFWPTQSNFVIST